MTPDTPLRDQPIFICGHPKSGTSLVRAILDSHPQLIVYPEETGFFRRYLPEASKCSPSEQTLPSLLALADERLIHIFKWNQETPDPSQEGFPDRDYSAIAFEDVRENMRQLAGQQFEHTGDILSAAILAYGQVCGRINAQTRYWVEKSPYNEYFAEQIYAWWPDARCIHIVRDPRDNYISYRRKHPDWSVEFFAANWTRSTGAGMRNRERFGAQRYLILRYEDLTQSPQSSLEKLTGFLQIDWDAALTQPTRAGEQWAGNSMFADRFQGISAAPVDRWKDNLSPEDAGVIEWMAGSLLSTWGYAPLPGKTFSQLLNARWRAATWPVRGKLSRLARSEPAQEYPKAEQEVPSE
ncbi:MAG: sulfotransferase [Chloroflexota bacterium]